MDRGHGDAPTYMGSEWTFRLVRRGNGPPGLPSGPRAGGPIGDDRHGPTFLLLEHQRLGLVAIF